MTDPAGPRRRLLFLSPPNLSMAYALVPLAHAASSAGHDVVFATASQAVERVAAAGLHVVDVAPDADFAAMQSAADFAFRSNRPDAAPVTSSRPHFFQLHADAMTPGTKRLVRWWRPDLVIHPPEGLTARELDVPAVYHGIRFANHPDHVEPWKRRESASVEGGAEAAWGTVAALDVTPASMSLCGPFGTAMRYVPYDGGGVLPGWLAEPRTRPRIAVTLGTVAPGVVGDAPLRRLLEAAPSCDAEFVFALGGTEPAALGPLPDRVRAEKWIPLKSVLQDCDAVIHQGGVGVTVAALDAGLPQMVLPQGADQFDTAEALSARGAGFTGQTQEPIESVSAQLDRLLHDGALREAAGQVRAELAATPGPCDVLSRLLGAVGGEGAA